MLRRYLLAPLLLASSATIVACFSSRTSDLVRQAEELTSEQRYDEAIQVYHDHIHNRLSTPDRPEWENPYFYLLMIGDIELLQGDITRALQDYEEAERQGVPRNLTSDRYRAVASWYEERQELEQSLFILRKYRDRDPLIFDAMLDRVARTLTERENGR